MRYGDALPAGFAIPSSGFWLRNDLRRNPYALLPLVPGDVVLDVGGYCGTFAAAAMEQGASRVVVYEAHPTNHARAVENLSRYGEACRVVHAACVADDAREAVLTLSGFDGAHSLVSGAKRVKTLRVPSVKFRDVVREAQPQVLKLDVEGAEYALLESLQRGDLSSVTGLFIEWHPIAARPARIAALRAYIRAEGLRERTTRLRAYIATRSGGQEEPWP